MEFLGYLFLSAVISVVVSYTVCRFYCSCQTTADGAQKGTCCKDTETQPTEG